MKTDLNVKECSKDDMLMPDASSVFSKRTKVHDCKDLPSLSDDGLIQPEKDKNTFSRMEERPNDNESRKNESRCDKCCSDKLHCFDPPILPQPLRRFLNLIYKPIGVILTYLLFFFVIYALLWVFTGPNAMPPTCSLYKRLPANESSVTKSKTGPAVVCSGGKFFSIIVYYAFAFAAGQFAELLRLPGLLGMLLSGLMLRCVSVFTTNYEIFNHPTIPPATMFSPVLVDANSTLIDDPLVIFAALLHVDKNLSAFLRQIAFSTILLCAGLGLELGVLRQVFTSVVRLTFIPCLVETTVAMVASKYLMGWTWPWAAMLSFVLSAVSPAVVVPSMMRLEKAGWGVAHGVPTIIVAASSLDNVLAITGFGIAFSIAFAKGNIALAIFMGPVEVVIGIISGFLLSVVLWLIPPPAMKHGNVFRGSMLYSISILSILGTVKLDAPGSGALCVLVFSFCTSIGWQFGLPWRFSPSHRIEQQVKFIEDAHEVNDEEMGGRVQSKRHKRYPQSVNASTPLVTGDEKEDKIVSASVAMIQRLSLPESKSCFEFSNINDEKERDHDKTPFQRSLSSRNPTSQCWWKISDSRQGSSLGGATTNTSSIHISAHLPVPSRTESVTQNDQANIQKQLIDIAKLKGLECLKIMRKYMATAWWFVEPFLFCLIGADVNVEKLRLDVVGRGIAALLLALCCRLIASVVALTPSPLRFKERIFTAIAWMPKATVQAAIGSLALDQARIIGNPVYIEWGEQILMLAALSILITAPLGAALMTLTAPCLLEQDHSVQEFSAKSSHSPEAGDDVIDDNHLNIRLIEENV